MIEKIKKMNEESGDPVNSEEKYTTFSLANVEYEFGILKIKEIIDKTTNMIFISYKEKLLAEPITYIVPAVWGERKDGKLTTIQREINRRIVPTIDSVMETLELEDLHGAQRFAIGYLIRGLLISKIAYMIEAFKNQDCKENGSNKKERDLLNQIEPLGNA
jgi:hypothetical protein